MHLELVADTPPLDWMPDWAQRLLKQPGLPEFCDLDHPMLPHRLKADQISPALPSGRIC